MNDDTPKWLKILGGIFTGFGALYFWLKIFGVL